MKDELRAQMETAQAVLLLVSGKVDTGQIYQAIKQGNYFAVNDADYAAMVSEGGGNVTDELFYEWAVVRSDALYDDLFPG